jgi:hypothetical protein
MYLGLIFSSLLGVTSGAGIGYAFGLLQAVALRRNEQRLREGNFKSSISLIPGAGARVAYLLVTLLIIQVVCPLLFRDGTQWWVSGGVLLGYGWTLYRQLMLRRMEAKA